MLSTDGSTISSNWISANDNTPSPVNSSNYYSYATYYYGLTSLSGTSTTTTFNVGLPTPFNSTSITNKGYPIYVYCRIGIPMNSQFSFSTLTAQLS